MKSNQKDQILRGKWLAPTFSAAGTLKHQAKSSWSLSPPAKHRARRIRTLDTIPGDVLAVRWTQDDMKRQSATRGCFVRVQSTARHSNIVGLPPTSIVSYQPTYFPWRSDSSMIVTFHQQNFQNFRLHIYSTHLLPPAPCLDGWPWWWRRNLRLPSPRTLLPCGW